MYRNPKLDDGAAKPALRWKGVLLGAATLAMVCGAAFPAAGATLWTSFELLDPIGASDLAKMRGGFILPNGMIVNVSLSFHTAVARANGIGEGVPFVVHRQTLGEADLDGGSGVIHTVTVTEHPGVPAVEISTDVVDRISGIMNIVQNNASAVAIQNITTLNTDILNAGLAAQAFQAGSFSMRLRGLGAMGL